MITDLSCIYRGGSTFTHFPCSHSNRCEAGPGGKRVALFGPGQSVLESCASACAEEEPTSHSHWERHKTDLFYITAVRINTVVRSLQCSRSTVSRIWASVTLITIIESVLNWARGTTDRNKMHARLILHFLYYKRNCIMTAKRPSSCKLQSVFVLREANVFFPPKPLKSN